MRQRTYVCKDGHETVVDVWAGQEDFMAPRSCSKCGKAVSRNTQGSVVVPRAWITECSKGHVATSEQKRKGGFRCPVKGCRGRVFRARGVEMRRPDKFRKGWYEGLRPTVEVDGKEAVELWRKKGYLRIDPLDGQEKTYFDSTRQRDDAVKDLNARAAWKGGWRRDMADKGVSEGAKSREEARGRRVKPRVAMGDFRARRSIR